jgi:peroxiredoxin Q/BCP
MTLSPNRDPSMPTEGQLAPDFTLNDQDGHPVTLSKFRGRMVVLYFYPKDATPGCTTEACDFRDAEPDFSKHKAVVLGISPDTSASHRKFVDKQSLNFTLLADPDKTVIEAYDVWKEKSMYGRSFMGVERTTFFIDKKGVIRKVFPKVKVAGHVSQVLEAVSSMD